MNQKALIRKQILQKRNQLSTFERNLKSQIICDRVMANEKFIYAETILIYMPIGSEVLTLPLIEAAWSLKKRVGIPKTNGNEMDFYELNDFNELIIGAFNVREPNHSNPISIKNTLLILPGVVFDYHKNRIGYGKGFYDRYLKSHSDIETIALAFECQIVDSIEVESHDISVNRIFTEQQIII